MQVAVTGWLSGSRSPTLRPRHCELELVILAEAWMYTLDTLTMRCRCAHKRICSRMHSGEELQSLFLPYKLWQRSRKLCRRTFWRY